MALILLSVHCLFNSAGQGRPQGATTAETTTSTTEHLPLHLFGQTYGAYSGTSIFQLLTCDDGHACATVSNMLPYARNVHSGTKAV